MKFPSYAIAFAAAATLSISAIAGEDDHHGHSHEHDRDHGAETISHYEAKDIKSAEEALSTLDESVAAIEPLVQGEELDANGFEKIHELSYTLEAAVDKLRESETKTNVDALDALDESVQAIHYASEEHKEAETREWFTKLQSATKDITHVF